MTHDAMLMVPRKVFELLMRIAEAAEQRRWVKQFLNYTDASTDSVTFDSFIDVS